MKVDKCKCGNHHILPNGSICEVCMLIVDSDKPEIDSRIDQQYYDELEELMEDAARTKLWIYLKQRICF